MNGFFGDGIDGVDKSYSSFVPSRNIMKMYYIIDTYLQDSAEPIGTTSIQNLHPHICCATRNDWARRSEMRRA
jgi:hypothetical protein